GVEGVADDADEEIESLLKRAVFRVGFLDDVAQVSGVFGDALVEDADGLIEVLDGRFGVAEEGGEQFGDLGGYSEVIRPDAALVLVEDGAAGVLEDDVLQRVVEVNLFDDLGFEVVAGVFGFPMAEGVAVFVVQDAIDADAVSGAALDRLFGQEGQLALVPRADFAQ